MRYRISLAILSLCTAIAARVGVHGVSSHARTMTAVAACADTQTTPAHAGQGLEIAVQHAQVFDGSLQFVRDVRGPGNSATAPHCPNATDDLTQGEDVAFADCSTGCLIGRAIGLLHH